MASRTYKEILANIDHFLIDADGVLTDNRVLLFPGIDPVRSFHSRDSYALQHAVKEDRKSVV